MGMKKYKKKSIEVEAVQWHKNGDHPDDGNPGAEGGVVRYFRHPRVPGDEVCRCRSVMHNHGWIDTLEGGHIVCPGDFIITGIAAERYPCKPDIFRATYEEVG